MTSGWSLVWAWWSRAFWLATLAPLWQLIFTRKWPGWYCRRSDCWCQVTPRRRRQAPPPALPRAFVLRHEQLAADRSSPQRASGSSTEGVFGSDGKTT